MNEAKHGLASLFIALLFTGCADHYRGYLYSGSATRSNSTSRTPPTPSVRQRVWHFGDTEYADTNGDGRIDREICDVEGHYGNDGYGRIKTDTDFDGFYDDERETGGIAGDLRWSRPIHEAVPPITRRLIPGELPY